MANVTLTTVVRNVGTLPLLLKMTDQLAASGQLAALRIIDETNSVAGAFEIRSHVKIDGDKGSLVPHLDESLIFAQDAHAYHGSKLNGYYHESTNKILEQNQAGLLVAVRGGGIIGLASQDNRKFEIVFDTGSCFVRVGRGGGTPITVHSAPGIGCGGKEWKLYTIAWQKNEIHVTAHDTSMTFITSCPRMDAPLVVTASARPEGFSDIFVVSAEPASIISTDSKIRSYATYHSTFPTSASGVEVISTDDIVYIDLEAWSDLSFGGAPLVVGDIASVSVLKRAGLLQASESENAVHSSFLSRSKGIVEKTRKLAADGVMIQAQNSVVKVSSASDLGKPVLFAVLSKNVVGNLTFHAGYLSLLVDGPLGETLSSSAKDVLVYLDSLAVDSPAMKDFLNEVVEALPKAERDYLQSLLARSN